MVSQIKKYRCFSIGWSLMALWLCAVYAPSALAQGDELFTPVVANQLIDATPSQKQRLDQINKRKSTASVALVQIDLGALHANNTRLSIPDGDALSFTGRKTDVKDENNFVWTGSVPGVSGEAILVVHDGKITGSIKDRQGVLYRVEPLGDSIHAVIKVDQRQFPPDHPPSFDQKAKEHRSALRPHRPSPDSKSPDSKKDGPVVIDVMVPYTPSARTAVADIAATIQLAVAEANQSYVNSGINIKLNLVSSFELSYSEAGKTYDTILADFVADPTVNAKRNSSNADLSAAIINQTDYCGLADTIRADASTAFALVHYDCATGYYSFAHELGHLQGARHNESNDPTTTPFPYGHGLQHLVAPAWRTIMAYDCPGGCPRLQYWSNPDITYNGIPMGTAGTNNNARVLNETALDVAAFRTASGPKACRAGYTQQGTRLCVSGGRGPATFANAVLDCMDSGGRVANYQDWRYRTFRGDGSAAPVEWWLGPITTDNKALYVNQANVGDYDGETSRFNPRNYACAHDLGR
jgi:hypothetical protein